MKTLRLVTMALALLALSFNAYGQNFVYNPPQAAFVLAPGESADVDFEVSLDETGGQFFFVMFVERVEGNLPEDWIAAAPALSWQVPAVTTLTVSVPEDAEPGTYSGSLVSASWSTAHVSETQGFFVSVIVPDACNKVPTVDIASIGPENLWAPNNSTQEVKLTGTVTMPEGCGTFRGTYSIDDEYGVCSGVGEFAIGAGGDFEVTIPVEVSRKGDDKDGRQYVIQLRAENEAGAGLSRTVNVKVAHDQGKK